MVIIRLYTTNPYANTWIKIVQGSYYLEDYTDQRKRNYFLLADGNPLFLSFLSFHWLEILSVYHYSTAIKSSLNHISRQDGTPSSVLRIRDVGRIGRIAMKCRLTKIRACIIQMFFRLTRFSTSTLQNYAYIGSNLCHELRPTGTCKIYGFEMHFIPIS